MTKYIVRLSVAVLAFCVGLVVANVWDLWRGSETRAWTITKVMTITEVSEDASDIVKIYREYGPAQTRHDRAFFERVETEDFTLTVGDEKLTREQDLQWLEQQPTDMKYEVRLDHMRVFGDSARARGRMLVTYGNGEVDEWPFIDVWVRRHGVWRIQSTTSNH